MRQTAVCCRTVPLLLLAQIATGGPPPVEMPGTLWAGAEDSHRTDASPAAAPTAFMPGPEAPAVFRPPLLPDGMDQCYQSCILVAPFVSLTEQSGAQVAHIRTTTGRSLQAADLRRYQQPTGARCFGPRRHAVLQGCACVRLVA